MRVLVDLYDEAVRFASTRETFSRDRFQRVMRVGFVTRDRLLLELEDASVIERLGRDQFRVVRSEA